MRVVPSNLLSVDPGLAGSYTFWVGTEIREIHPWKGAAEASARVGETPVTHVVIEDCKTATLQSPTDAAKLMVNKGWWMGLAEGIGIPPAMVDPFLWTKPWRPPGRGKLTYSQRKTAWHQAARKLYPKQPGLCRDTADSVLIGWWALQPGHLDLIMRP